MKRSKDLPPKFLLRFFQWYCDSRLASYIEGDLIELYRERVVAFGKRKANFRFMIDVLLLFRPGIIKEVRLPELNPNGMYRNYLKVSLRNLTKNKAFSFINLAGLSLGLACSILTGLWVYNEYSIDAFHKDGDRLYAVTSVYHFGTELIGSYGTPALLAEEIKKAIPDVEAATGLGWATDHSFSVGDKKIKTNGNYASADFFQMFSYPLVEGDRQSADGFA